MKNTRLLIPLLAAAFGIVSPLAAGTSAHVIRAHAAGQDDGPGKIIGKVSGGGLLHGSLEGAITLMPPPVDGMMRFTEVVTFTTGQGTLTVSVDGSINLSTGEFCAPGTVIDATGKLAGATGSITFCGVILAGDTHPFVETISGVIYVDL